MCEICGCNHHAQPTAVNLRTGAVVALDGEPHASEPVHEHVLADGTRYVHAHAGPHPHHDHRTGMVEIETRVLAKNDALAAENRARLRERRILALNLMGAPGAGKTALLERTIRAIGNRMALFVLEGDQATANNGERIRDAGAPVIQVNTGTGCHLDADLVARGLSALEPRPGGIVVIENVGNLVCPALFDLGETRRVVVLSVTEGDDKPVKYPHMFRAADLVLLNKIDLLPYVDFDVARAVGHARALRPDVAVLRVSARTGEGLDEWFEWLGRQQREAGGTRPVIP
jgi:hydrogenase nickel incorporation protein HypB